MIFNIFCILYTVYMYVWVMECALKYFYNNTFNVNIISYYSFSSETMMIQWLLCVPTSLQQPRLYRGLLNIDQLLFPYSVVYKYILALPWRPWFALPCWPAEIDPCFITSSEDVVLHHKQWPIVAGTLLSEPGKGNNSTVKEGSLP